MQFFEGKLQNLQTQMNEIDQVKIREGDGINQMPKKLILMSNGNE